MNTPTDAGLREILIAAVDEQLSLENKTAPASAGAIPGQAASQETKTDPKPPVSKERLQICMESATRWAEELPRYASRQQDKADRWAIAAGVIAAITGLSIFPTESSNTNIWVTVAVAAAAFLAAVFALVPRVKNYGEMAGKARELAAVYGPLKGKLTDAVAEMEAGKGTDGTRQVIVAEFESAKAKKDELRYLPF